jgi:catechol 2,3-dioxygenase-like lactoylglutathione lyase family enzyme
MIHLLFTALVASAQPESAHVDSVEIVVRDLPAERRFYEHALHFSDEGERPVAGGKSERLTLGGQHVDLIVYDRAGQSISADARSNDRDFQHVAVIVSDMNRAWAWVQRFPIHSVSAGPQLLPRWNPNAGGIAAVYFRDPEGHPLELLHFPPDKGAAQWHAASPLFLGIDHTAIAVTNSTVSTRFYEALGLTVKGHSNNYGIEQERLSGVKGAHVAITAVRFESAPGVEFLQYLNPPAPQPPEREAVYDLGATRTLIITPKSASLCASLHPIVQMYGNCIVRDPDGHLVEIR